MLREKVIDLFLFECSYRNRLKLSLIDIMTIIIIIIILCPFPDVDVSEKWNTAWVKVYITYGPADHSTQSVLFVHVRCTAYNIYIIYELLLRTDNWNCTSGTSFCSLPIIPPPTIWVVLPFSVDQTLLGVVPLFKLNQFSSIGTYSLCEIR